MRSGTVATSVEHETLATFKGRDLCYVIQAAIGGPVKIGHSKCVLARIGEMQCGNPYPLVVRALLVGGIATERQAHHRFADWRISGEWFSPESIGLICEWLDDNSLLVAGGRWSDDAYVSPAPTKAHLRARMRSVLMRDSSLEVIASALREPHGDLFDDAIKLARRIDEPLAIELRSRSAS